jgi:hypothetical protein
MFSNYLSTIEGIGIFPLISLLIFISFFTAVLIWIFKADKNYIKKMEELPLDSNNNSKEYSSGEENDY